MYTQWGEISNIKGQAVKLLIKMLFLLQIPFSNDFSCVSKVETIWRQAEWKEINMTSPKNKLDHFLSM